jgi:beta-alanine--pyruvate transaminase
MASSFENAVHSLSALPNVIDVRNIGLVAGVELAPIAGEPGKRAFQVFLDCWENGLLVRTTGDTVALSPPLIVDHQHIDQMIGTLANAIRRAA